jgi:hypothetical protein
MSKSLRYTFIVHAIVAFVLGAPLLLAPGRTLGLFGWAPVDPLISRILGAALLGLAWSSFRGWRAAERKQVAVLIELEAIFCVLSCIGMVRQTFGYYYPYYVWALLVILAAFAVAWVYALVRK